MTDILAVVLWPAGITAIAGAATLVARWIPRRFPGRAPTSPLPSPGRHGAPPSTRGIPPGYAVINVARFAFILIAGAVVVYAATVLLGLAVEHAGPAADKPFYHWMVAHRVLPWANVMERATKIGNTWTTWGAAGAAAVCLAMTWRSNRWLPPVALGSLILCDKFLIIAVHQAIHRAGPPGSPLGTFPSGGADRSVAFYGLIAYLLWRESGGSHRAATWLAAGVAALGFNEGYSRAYLTLHWLTDIASGWVFGCLLLAAFITAVRFVAGPARVSAAGAGMAPATAMAPAPGRSA